MMVFLKRVLPALFALAFNTDLEQGLRLYALPDVLELSLVSWKGAGDLQQHPFQSSSAPAMARSPRRRGWR